jgi:hypothetical protein
MADMPQPELGSVVTYMDHHVPGLPFVRAEVTGPVVADPTTGSNWVPILGPDRVSTLLNPDLIVDVFPAPPAETG